MQQLTNVIASVFVFPLSQSRSPLGDRLTLGTTHPAWCWEGAALGAFGDEGKDFCVPPT